MAGQHSFTVHANGQSFIIAAEDFEVDRDGVHFIDKAGTDQAFVHAFVSHPCTIIQDRPA